MVNEKKTYFSLCVFDSDVQCALLLPISLTTTRHDLSFCIVVSKFEG